ncbi:site-specific DNA-methyltransferase [Sphingobacteriaceae bacterium]|nr:site-specific DNA-methyltransferase [Sphingobacteriaceae bacterium]
MKHPLLSACGIPIGDKKSLQDFINKTEVSAASLKYYDSNGILPFDNDLNRILAHLKIDETTFKIRMGIFDYTVREFLASKHGAVNTEADKAQKKHKLDLQKPAFKTRLGKMYKGDCISLLQSLETDSVDMVFADPPFNLKKFYLSSIDDDLPQNEYIRWTEEWLNDCIRVLKPGGSLFIWNIPKWNTYFSNYLNSRLTFRHWIATDIKFSLPISGRLYPSHYSLLYYVKGERPNTFTPDRMQMELCPSCYVDLKDYGGYKNKMNPDGINLTDVWYDIPPVRHKKYKRRLEANELSIKLLDRIIEMSTKPGDIVFDPFGGSGTTYVTAELKGRKWIGAELGPIDAIVERFDMLVEEKQLLDKYRSNYNKLFPTEIKLKRKQLKMWTDDSFK